MACDLAKGDLVCQMFAARLRHVLGRPPRTGEEPFGQTLIVTAGCWRVQREGGPIEEIRPGDIVWFPPGEKHRHGASPTTAMTHIAIQEQLDGKAGFLFLAKTSPLL